MFGINIIIIMKKRFWGFIFLSFMFYVASSYATYNTSSFMFKHLSIENGLSDNNIRHIYKDNKGYLWIGTPSGLNQYNGHSFKQYNKDNSELPDDYIAEIFEDPNQNIWIRLLQGYSVYNYQTGKFDNNYAQFLDKLNIPSQHILKVGCTNNEFWAYDAAKIYIVNPQNIKTYPIKVPDLSKISISPHHIYSIYNNGEILHTNRQTSETKRIFIPQNYISEIINKEPSIYTDNNEGIWVYTFQNSCLLYKKNQKSQWEKIELFPKNQIPFNRIHQILDIGNGNICILTSHMGLFIYNKNNQAIFNLTHNSQKRHTICSNNLTSVHLDQAGNIWIGSFKHGISYHSPILPIILNNHTLSYDILSFCKDENAQCIYYGTDGDGVIQQYLGSDIIKVLDIPANVIVDLAMDKDKRLWIGSYRNGLLCYEKGKTKKYTTENSQILDNDIYDLEIDKYGRIWIGTLKGYIQRYDPSTNQFETIIHHSEEFKISDMHYDDNTIYAATSEGLIRINIETNAYQFFDHTDGFKEDEILTVYKDSRGLVWAGHSHGLSVWNPQNDSIAFIDSSKGLTANFIKTIIEDDYGQMWIGTGNGASRIQINAKGFSIVNYSVNDGLICNDANVHATLKLSNGNILIGTPKGYHTIVPQEIIVNDYKANIHLTDIKLAHPDDLENILGGQSIECLENITLKENNNTLTLSFSALDLIESDKIKYAYKLGDKNNFWINADNNKINLSMLPIGKHQLFVKVCNSQGNWSENVKTIQLNILPPWYRSIFAYFIYFCICICIIALVLRQIQKKKKQELLFLSIEEENERQKQLSDMKLQFFANISHELRTPLSLIINPLEEFFDKYPEHRQGLLDIVKKNATYLLELINQLLDFRKLDASMEKLNCNHDNILIILSDIFHSFDSTAKSRHINYTFVHNQPSIYMDFDYDKIRKITTNILSNAFKFTPNNGSISLHLEVVSSHLILSFMDTGCGIEDEAKEKVFQRFYQFNKDKTGGGSGIGLHIVSEYVKMHQGEIEIKDNTPTGCIVQIKLPIHQNIEQENNQSLTENSIEANEQEECQFSILLVDDNNDFLTFLSESLSKHYQIFKASNGKQALEVIDKEDVDLIVSDIMMPEMDGLELCTAIKNDIRYSHISIILLTAKSSEEHLLEGLSVGADDYITKPFNMEILKLRINKIIEMNTKRIEIFNNEINIEPSKIAITPLDQQLVEKAIKIVEDHICQSEFSVEELATELNLSRSYFYKKMIKITGKKPIEFIRTIRMKRAKQLLAESQMQVAEIAYMLGYNSPKIFSKHFKEEFNISPSNFKKQH